MQDIARAIQTFQSELEHSVYSNCFWRHLVQLVDINQFQGVYDTAFLSFGDFPEYILLKINLLPLRNKIVLHMQQVAMENMSRVLKHILKMIDIPVFNAKSHCEANHLPMHRLNCV